MPFFSETIAAHVAGGTIRAAHLFEAQFLSKTLRLWTGWGTLATGGREWEGSGGLIAVSDLDASASSFASPFAITLSGLPDESYDLYTRMMLSDPAEYRTRPVSVLLQFFDDAWQPLDEPMVMRSGFMDVPSFTGTAQSESIAMKCEGALVVRRRPRWGYYTNEDQQRRYPGDKGFEYAPASATRQVKAPIL